MKRFILILVCLATFLCAVANADTIDLSGMTYDELVELVNEAQRMIMFSDFWQEVEVPQGEYIVGKDIPEGKWLITASPTKVSSISQRRLTKYRNGFELEEEGFYDYITNAQLTGVETPHYKSYQMDSVTIELVDGDLFCVETGAVIFTPSKGLGFKFK